MKISIFLSVLFILISCVSAPPQNAGRGLASVQAYKCFTSQRPVSSDFDKAIRECAKRYFISDVVLNGEGPQGIVVSDLYVRYLDSEVMVNAMVYKGQVKESKQVFLMRIDDQIRISESQPDLGGELQEGKTYCEGVEVGGEWSCAKRIVLSKMIMDGEDNLKLSCLKSIAAAKQDVVEEGFSTGSRVYHARLPDGRSKYVSLKYEKNPEEGTEKILNYGDNTPWSRFLRKLLMEDRDLPTPCEK